MIGNLAREIKPASKAKPVLKWAGGKSQLLYKILPNVPTDYGKYIEPFIGGGALFFATSPQCGVIADSNPELVNFYKTLKESSEELIKVLAKLKTDEKSFYSIRAQNWEKLSSVEMAARTLYLNKTCFNGLYRVNKSGHFNVPYGRYKNPNICDVEGIQKASLCLKNTAIVLGDYKTVLKKYARSGDFVFLDPPYLPISKYSDFKRYTKEQFYEEDHQELASEVRRLSNLGCHVILTNSNHPLVHELYDGFKIEVVQTKRNINKKGNARTGEDVIVQAPPVRKLLIRSVPDPLPAQVFKYPSTRFMGSKEKLLPHIWEVARQFDFDSVLDLFSGSGVVGYMFKAKGKSVFSNDYMAMSSTFTTAMIENNNVKLNSDDIERLLKRKVAKDHFVSKTFKNLYFKDSENEFIDDVRTNIKKITNRYKRAIAMSALIRACMKKRPRGIFTYVGDRYDDGRKDLKMRFADQFESAIYSINDSIFDNGKDNFSKRGDALTVKSKQDLVYIDPPYYSPLSDNEYVRRYHFVEGLACDWKDVEMQWHTKTKKFKNYPTPFSSRIGAHEAFDHLFSKFKDSILMVSYSSNSSPSRDEIVGLMARYKKQVEVIAIDYKYSFGTHGHKVGNNKNDVQEYLFVGF